QRLAVRTSEWSDVTRFGRLALELLRRPTAERPSARTSERSTISFRCDTRCERLAVQAANRLDVPDGEGTERMRDRAAPLGRQDVWRFSGSTRKPRKLRVNRSQPVVDERSQGALVPTDDATDHAPIGKERDDGRDRVPLQCREPLRHLFDVD